MKKLLWCLCISWATSLQAQQFKTDFSANGKVEDDVTRFHKYGDKLYSYIVNWGKMQFAFSATLKKVKYGIEITQYNEQLKELKTLSLDKGGKDFGPFSPMVHFGEDAIFVMYFKFTDEDKVKMFVSKINPEDLSVITTQEVMEYDQRNQAIWGTIKTIGDAQALYTVSPDGKKAWIVHASPSLIVSSVIDSDLNLIQKTQSVPVKLKDLVITDAHIDNDGHKALAYRYDDEQNKEFYIRGIFFQPADTKGTFKTVKLNKGHFPGSLSFQASKDGKRLHLLGEYYGEDYAFGGQGVLLGEIDILSQSIPTPTFYPYTPELKQRVLDLDFASKKKGEIVFADRNIVYRMTEMGNGTIVLSSDMATSASTSNATFYYTGPVIHIFIKPGGNATMTLIPKKQASGSATGFFNYVYKDKLVCIYADLPRFQEKELGDKQIGLVRTLGGMVPVANVYDSDGKLLSRQMLVDNKKSMDGNVMINHRSTITGNKFMFPVGESKTSMVKYYTKVNQMCYLEIL